MTRFLHWTAWKMDMPAAYGPFHIICTALLLAITIFAARRLRNTTEKQNRLVLVTVGGFLLITEVYKILFHIVRSLRMGLLGCIPIPAMFCAYVFKYHLCFPSKKTYQSLAL